jgi:ubiquinone/menaquinone biosynthesis C-methylase UbiE
MQHSNTTLKDVNGVYDGPEGVLWELIMGEQIHVGGMNSSKILAEKTGLKKGLKGLDLCSALGAGCRFLVKYYGVTMAGLDGTQTMHQKAQERAKAEGLADKIEFKLGDVTAIPWPDNTFDFVWGEDAWCYVVDKGKLITEAARVVKPGGVVAFTDWIEGNVAMTPEESKRVLDFMKFPYMESMEGYRGLLKNAGMKIETDDYLFPEFSKYVELYLRMLTEQLTSDALKIIGDNMELFQGMGGEMMFMLELAKAGKMDRCRFVARK